MNSGNNGVPAPGAVGGFWGGGGGSEEDGASGGGGGYSGGCSGTHAKQAGGGRGSYCNGKDCFGLTGGNSNDDGVVQILELMSWIKKTEYQIIHLVFLNSCFVYQQIIVLGVNVFLYIPVWFLASVLISNLIDFNPTFGEEKSPLGLSETDYDYLNSTSLSPLFSWTILNCKCYSERLDIITDVLRLARYSG